RWRAPFANRRTRASARRSRLACVFPIRAGRTWWRPWDAPSPFVRFRLRTAYAPRTRPRPSLSAFNGGGTRPAAQDFQKIARLFDGKYNYRKTVVPSKRDGRAVHDLEVASQNLSIRQTIVANGLGILARIRRIDPVHLGGLRHGIASHLDGSERRSGIGREE